MTNLRTPRALTSGAGAVALGLLLAAPAAAAEWPDPKVNISDGQSVIKLLAHTEEETFTPKGGKPTTGEPDRRPEVGDSFAFVDSNTQDGTKVGTNTGRCEVVSSTEKSVTSRCAVTVALADGTLTIHGDAVFSQETAPFTIPITGGTGAYAGARGTAKVLDVDEKDSDLTLTFRTASAKSGGQVSVAPVGGAETGGGFAAERDDTALFAWGAFGIAAGGALFVAGRRSARRSI